MYLSSTDGVNSSNIEDNSPKRQSNTTLVASNSTQPQSPSCAMLLVIDDNSNTNDSLSTTAGIPSNSMPLSSQLAHIEVTSSSPSSNLDNQSDTAEQQRRRNSSIAKLLGGQPLNNQQYEEINQQVLDDQSAQNAFNNSDTKNEGEIQRSRSSITRKLLLNAERNNNNHDNINTNTNTNNNNVSSIKTDTQPLPSGFSNDFEYLIRRELDVEYAPSTLHRDSSVPSIFQNTSNSRNEVSPTPSQSKLKRKRSLPKQTSPITKLNKLPNSTTYVERSPFELESIRPVINQTIIHPSHVHQNDLYRFDASRRYYHQRQHSQNQQQFSSTMNNSVAYSSPCNYPKQNFNQSIYSPVKSRHGYLLQNSRSSSAASTSVNYHNYPVRLELGLPMAVSSVSSFESQSSRVACRFNEASSRKTKVTQNQQDVHEIQKQQTYPSQSNQSDNSPSTTLDYSVPLKKRLLVAYKNEQHPKSAL